MKEGISGKRVADCMTLSVPVVSPRTSVPDALRIVQGNGISALPVCDGGRFLGLVREKDLLAMVPSRATSLSRHEIPSLLEKVTVGAVVTVPPASVASDLSLREAAKIMVETSSEIIPVLENGRYAGLVSWRDLFGAALEDHPCADACGRDAAIPG